MNAGTVRAAAVHEHERALHSEEQQAGRNWSSMRLNSTISTASTSTANTFATTGGIIATNPGAIAAVAANIPQCALGGGRMIRNGKNYSIW